MVRKRASGRTMMLRQTDTGWFTVLGLDCSSSTIGWGLIGRHSDGTLALMSHGHIKPLPSKCGFMERLNDVFDRISALCATFKPDAVAVEDIIQHISGGSSMAQTITILAAFNRVAALAAWREIGNVAFYPVATIRKIIRQNVGRKAKIGKEEMPAIVRAHLEPQFSDVPKTRGEGPAETTCDEADGIAVAWACAIDTRGKE